MKKTILTFAILLFAFAANAQEQKKQKDDGKIIVANDTDETIYNAVENRPDFPGGIKNFYEYVANNYKYPAGFKGKGKVIAQFVVEKDGTLSNIKVLRDLGFGTGEEAARVLAASPKWSPGMQNGRAVRVMYSLPISLVN